MLLLPPRLLLSWLSHTMLSAGPELLSRSEASRLALAVVLQLLALGVLRLEGGENSSTEFEVSSLVAVKLA